MPASKDSSGPVVEMAKAEQQQQQPVQGPRRMISEEETLEGHVIGDILQKLREEHAVPSNKEKGSMAPQRRLDRLYRVLRRSESASSLKHSVNPARKAAASVPAPEKSSPREYKLMSYILRAWGRKEPLRQ